MPFTPGDKVRIKDTPNVPPEHRMKTGTVSLVEDRPVWFDTTLQWVTVDCDDGGQVRMIDSEVESESAFVVALSKTEDDAECPE